MLTNLLNALLTKSTLPIPESEDDIAVSDQEATEDISESVSLFTSPSLLDGGNATRVAYNLLTSEESPVEPTYPR